MINSPEIKATNKKIPAHKVLKIAKYIWLLSGTLITTSIACIVYILLTGLTPSSSLFSITSFRDLLQIVIALIIYASITVPITVVSFTATFPVFSFIHIIQLFLTPKQLKRKPIAIIFRILTVLFGIASIVFVVLFVTKTICAYDFLRSVSLFTGGSIVLNIFVE